jgi:AcrR family transcriptional regulator
MAVTPLEPGRLERVREWLRTRDLREVTTEEIAEAVGLSRMTLYRRGIDRDALLSQLRHQLESEYQEAVLPALVSPAPAAERLRAALSALCEVNERYLHLLDALGTAREFLFHEPGTGQVLTRVSFTDGLRRILEDGVADGTLRPAPQGAEELATLLFNATGWTYRHMRAGHRWEPTPVREQVVALLLDGVRA